MTSDRQVIGFTRSGRPVYRIAGGAAGDFDGGTPIYAEVLRAALLDANGTPTTGTLKAISTAKVVAVTMSPNNNTSPEVRENLGNGQTCLALAAVQSFAWWDVVITMCPDNPLLAEILMGWTTHRNVATDIIGMGSPAVGTDGRPNGVYLDVWQRRKVGNADAAAFPFSRILIGKLSNVTRQEIELSANKRPVIYRGTGYTNANLGDGPFNDIPTTITAAQTNVPYLETFHTALPTTNELVLLTVT